jgi:adenylate kinase family enzyme
MGPSGSGTTTLAKELSKKLKISQEDTDNMFWEQTDPPFSVQRNIEDLHNCFYNFTSQDQFILSGDVLNWGIPKDTLLKIFKHIIYLYTPWEIREKRIRDRENKRFGNRIKFGGDMYQTHEDFIQWASKYESDRQIGRNRLSQKNFIKHFLDKSENILEIEKDLPLKSVVEKSLVFLK